MTKGLEIKNQSIAAESDSGRSGMSRRTMLGGAALAVGVGASFAMTTGAAAKTAQDAAKYQDKPQGSAKCSGCSQFEAPEGCKLVEGKISPEGWCQLYAPKAG